jgi:hypothetical protein
MNDNAITEPALQEQKTSPVEDFLWGAEEIGKPIRRTKRQTHHMLDRGLIKSARKVGGLWVANRAALLREFGA